jgi:hypothetical protein
VSKIVFGFGTHFQAESLRVQMRKTKRIREGLNGRKEYQNKSRAEAEGLEGGCTISQDSQMAPCLDSAQYSTAPESYATEVKKQTPMPYKNPERKKDWERRHRPERLARRRELRRERAAEVTTLAGPDSMTKQGFACLVLGGGGLTLALYRPGLALGAGSLILTIAAIKKKSWQWWVLGVVITVAALFVLSSDQRSDSTGAISATE